MVGLVGRNGSGKTTLLRLLQGRAAPTAGRAMLFGVDGLALGDAELARVGVVHQENRFVAWMSGRAHLDFTRSFYARWDAARERRLVEAFELDLTQRTGAMSPGAVQKLAIVTAVCHRPEAILLDEPAASLDPPRRRWRRSAAGSGVRRRRRRPRRQVLRTTRIEVGCGRRSVGSWNQLSAWARIFDSSLPSCVHSPAESPANWRF